MRHVSACALAAAVAACATAPADPEIAADRLSAHVHELADDRYEGRGAGYPGEALAARYIADAFAEAGVAPAYPGRRGADAYLQEFEIEEIEGPVAWRTMTSRNVVAVRPGGARADEVVVFGAHFDGQGMEGQARLGREMGGIETYEPEPGDVIWNSAVDNAVSVAAMLEIARWLEVNDVTLDRTIVFAAFGAEESGLDGSVALAFDPPLPDADVVAMLNMEKLVGDPAAEFLYAQSGTSPMWNAIDAELAGRSDVTMTDFYPGVIANTDHYPFALAGVPAITIGTGSTHNDHRRTDIAEILDYDMLKTRTDFIRDYLIAVANYDGDMSFTADLSEYVGVTGGPATADELAARGVDADAGFKVARAIPGSNGARAGLRAGDLIVAVNGEPLEGQGMYQGLESTLGFETADAADVTVVRDDGSRVELTVAKAKP